MSRVAIASLYLMSCLGACATAPPRADDPSEHGFEPIFDGYTLDGWEKHGGGATYHVEDGCIVGTVGPGRNTFLCTQRTFRDFVLRLEVRMEVPGNSGIQFRSHIREDDVVFGYQCELDEKDRRWTGGIYDESRRGWLFPLDGEDMGAQRAAFHPTQWNTIEIRCDGPEIRTFVNGVPCAHLADDADSEGIIALQVHSGLAGRILWRNVRLRELRPPSPGSGS